MNSYERMGIIASARNIDGPDFDQAVKDASGPGKYEYVVESSRELAVAARTIVLNGFADEEGEGGFAVVNSILYYEDEFGFVYIWIYDSFEKAEQALIANTIDGQYPQAG